MENSNIISTLKDEGAYLKNILLVIDVQKEFKDQNGNYEKIIRFVEDNYEDFDEVVAVYCDGKPNKFDGKFALASSMGMNFIADETSLEFPYDRTISKSTYAVPLNKLNRNAIYTIIGCESDICVLATAFAMYDEGFIFYVKKDFIYSNAKNLSKKTIEGIYKRNFDSVLD